jgi:hypothetical protein
MVARFPWWAKIAARATLMRLPLDYRFWKLPEDELLVSGFHVLLKAI